jgi:uncharacterized membrane protein
MNSEWAPRWRAATLILALLLVLLIAIRHVTTTIDPWHVALALCLSVPALAPMRGLSRYDRRTYRWATLCAIPYFVIGLTEAIADPSARVWAFGLLIGALGWFVTLIAYLRVSAPQVH